MILFQFNMELKGYNKMITIYDIKYSLVNNPYFFSRNTLKFFGQTLKDFKVKKSPTNRVFIYAPIRIDGRISGYTFREYKDNKLCFVYDDNSQLVNTYKLENIISHINTH